MLPNRVAVYAGLIAGLIAAIAPVAANMDWTSTAGVIAGVGAIALVINRYLIGWQKHEMITADPGLKTPESIVKRRHPLPLPAERPE